MTLYKPTIKLLGPVLFIVNAVLLLFAVSTFTSERSESTRQCAPSIISIPDQSKSHIVDQIATIRNQLSRQLNDMSKKYGQMECEKRSSGVNEHGGWCKELGKETSREHKTDKNLLPALSELLKGKTVGSFGDGPGLYKREILKLGKLASYDAYDGAPFCEETSQGRVKFLDLTIPQYGIPIYDWIISLEVAEHIPNKYESVYLDNIFRHAKEGIVLSWAVPGQGGLSHVNNKPLSFVIDTMKNNGFVHDEVKSKELRKAASFWWLKNNINIYRRDHFSKFKNESLLSQYYV